MKINAAEAAALLPATNEFLDSILRLQSRVAAFDCDGTLWSGDAGERFFDWELREGGLVSESMVRPLRERYAAYKRGEVDETTMCGEMVTMHKGISERKMTEAANRFFDQFLKLAVAQITEDQARVLIWIVREAPLQFGVDAAGHDD